MSADGKLWEYPDLGGMDESSGSHGVICDEETQFMYYPRAEYEEYLGQSLPQTQETFAKIEEPYSEFASETYLQVPENRLGRLTEIVNQRPLTDPGEITQYIREFLWSHATYSLTPGMMPLGEEVAEYFLFEGGQGYCQHFATAATLLYRLYGIPARYAAGYSVQPEEFEESEDGLYRAVLTDGQAHAWVEIYLKDAGWIPVEVTPSAWSDRETEEELAENIQQNPALSDTQPAENGETESPREQMTEEEAESVEELPHTELETGETGGGLSGNLQRVATAILVLAGVAIVLCAVRLARQKLFRTASGRYRQAMKMGIHERAEQEKQQERIRELERASLKECFGRNGLSQEEELRTEEIYLQFKQENCKSAPLFARLYIQFWF